MARFQREAKVLASLDHPNIASIYGLEDSGGTRALVIRRSPIGSRPVRFPSMSLPLLRPKLYLPYAELQAIAVL
jgi:serine/threonine protein kinase